MKRAFIFFNTLIFILFTGCAIEDERSINQYEAKLIVSSVLRSQHSLNESAMMTSTSLCYIEPNHQNNIYYMQDYYYPDNSFSIILNGYDQSLYSSNSYFSLSFSDNLYNYNHINGIINININSNSYNNSNLDYLATYNDINIYSDNYNYLVNGDVGVKVNLDTLNNNITLHYSTDALRLYNSIGRDTYLRGTTLDFYMNLYNNQYRYTYNGNLSLSRWDNVYFQTITPFIGYANLNPYQGSMKIIIRSQTMYVDVLDANFVNIKLFYPNSNSYITIRTNWKELGF